MKVVKKILLFLLLVLLAIQFIRPDKNKSDAPVDTVFIEETNPPEDVAAILRSSCYDCHSNNTVYPWYFNIAPVSFWMDHHVKDGKGDLNFSEWDTYDNKKKDHKLEEVVEMVEEGEMPLSEYTWTHPEARLTDGQRNSVIEWADRTRALYQLGQRPE